MSNAAPQLPDLSQWLTDDEAIARLGIGRRSLDRESEGGRLHPMKRPVPGQRAERVWDPAEIDARAPQPPRSMQVVSTVPPSMSGMSESSHLPALPGSMGAEAMEAVIMRLVEMVAAASQSPKPWITLDEASEATGLSRKLLRRLIGNGQLQGVRDVSIKVHRGDLDTLDVSSELVKTAKKGKAKR